MLLQLSRNFLWTNSSDYKRAPLLAWDTVCLPKSRGGLGIKDFSRWNAALMAKHVWAVETKKDMLWVKWVHEKYLKGRNWWEYTPPHDCSWGWKQICKVKEQYKTYLKEQTQYTVAKGYKWLQPAAEKVSWASHTWSRIAVPRHVFILWLYRHRRLSTKTHLGKYKSGLDTKCVICKTADEDITHLFHQCSHATSIWNTIFSWWPDWKKHLPKLIEGKALRKSKLEENILTALFAAVIYHIWAIRNQVLFRETSIPSAHYTARQIKEQLSQRLLFFSTRSQRNTLCT